ncbi:energy transducer TonB [Phaeobacter sp.]|uniref:energy transducer TonB n=1 Tax=Phaeobacter sp. TaxID=1902409 RepID=UPI0025F6F616|nr:energy transducer TonB [Phaeobacter sp.]
MQTGTKISLAGHGLLAGWVAVGGWFSSAPPPVTVQEVSLISEQAFERLTQQRAAPEIGAEAAALTPPDTEPSPELRPQANPAVPSVQPPEPVAPPTPDREVTEVPPQPVPAEPAETPPPLDVPSDALDTATILPDVAETTQLRPADRVAPTPIAPPEPDVRIDEVAQPEIGPGEGQEAEQQPQDQTAEAAANDRVVTEDIEAENDQRASAAPARSLRPQSRPRRPDPEPVSDPTPEPPRAEVAEEPAEDRAAAVEDALAAAIAGGADVIAPEPSGPPLTSGERDALRLAVQKCWNVGSLSSEALRTTVVVAVSLSPEGRPQDGSIRLLSSTGGSGAAATQAFGAARRAILRCGASGFQLPSDKYAQWRNIEMTFNPERMRIR